MITSSQQHNASKEAANDLRKMLLAEPDPDIPTGLVAVNRKRLKKKLTTIEKDIKEYEESVKLDLSTLKFDKFEDLLKAPIRYRLANNESVKEFAEEVGINKRQILRYEEEAYQNCSIPTLFKILDHIGVRITGEIKI